MCVWAFCCFCCYWRPALVLGDLIGCMGLFQSSYICWGLFCDRLYGQFWRRYYEVLRRRYIFCFRMKCSINVRSSRFITSVGFTVSLFSFCFQETLLRVGCWSLPLWLYGVWCVLWTLVKFQMPFYLEHRCSELRAHLGRFFLWQVLSVLSFFILFNIKMATPACFFRPFA